MKSISADELYEAAGIEPTGTTLWGVDVPSKQSDVYVISVADLSAVQFLEPFAAEHGDRWKADQEIVYIGRARVLSRRLRQFRKHVYGDPSPHRGGQAILLLDCQKVIRWAAIEDFGGAEDALIKAFQRHAERMPFGNRVSSAKMNSKSRFAAEPKDIQMLGKHVKTVNHLTQEDEAQNDEHDRMIATLFDKNSN